MDVFDYIAASDPIRCKGILHNYGYQFDPRNMAQNLRDLCEHQGEKAFFEIMELHPDQEFFLKLGKKKYKKQPLPYSNYPYYQLNAAGPVQQTGTIATESAKSANQLNLMIIGSALVISLALILHKK